LSKQTGMEVNR